VLEITEEILMNELGEVSRIVKELKEVGIEVALDDFGKGFSSLNYLQFVDFSEIKIDKSFVDNIVEDPKSRSLISAICRIGKDLNMRIVCEGVETKDQMEILKEMDCDLIQGYLFSRPYPV
jgi:EAL domain-containing protein (putative c-di-GMP-specific phosphodiesterase class I)